MIRQMGCVIEGEIGDGVGWTSSHKLAIDVSTVEQQF